MTIKTDSLDVMPEGGTPPRAPAAETPGALLSLFDGQTGDPRAALAGASDVDLKPCPLLVRREITLTFPRIAILRNSLLHHSIHHRGQLTVYLRMSDVPKPALYGPSADEGALGF